jgi:hypothetical protein
MASFHPVSAQSGQTENGHSPFIPNAVMPDHHLANSGQEVKGYVIRSPRSGGRGTQAEISEPNGR